MSPTAAFATVLPDLKAAALPDSIAVRTADQGLDRDGPVISRDEILVVVKRSSFKCELQKTHMSPEQLLMKFEQQGECGQRTVSSHLRQLQVVKDLCAEISPTQIVSIAKVTRERVAKAKMIIALGGDDTLKAVSHWIDDQTIIVGVNSDTMYSQGNLIRYSAADIPALLRSVEKGDYRIQPWQRIRIAVDGVDRGPALSEIALAKSDFAEMTTNIVEFKGQKVNQKSSGLLLTTGAGSTGWFASAGLYLAPEGRPYPPTVPLARFELREPHLRFVEKDGTLQAVYPDLVEGEILPGETLKVTSLNNTQAIATRDSIDRIPFNRGSVAEIALDNKPLWVVAPGAARGGMQ